MKTQTVPLSEVATFVRGVTFDKTQLEGSQNGGNVPLLRAGNIGKILDVKDDLIFIPKSAVSPEQLLRKGDIAICLSSGSPKLVGKTAPLLSDWNGSVGAFCGIIRPRDVIDPDYLSLWFRSSAFIDWRNEQARGAGIQNLRFSGLASLKISVPKKIDQRRIATHLKAQLAAATEACNAAQKQMDDVEALRAALYREAFADIVPVGVPPVFENAPPSWHWRKLTDCAQLESGHTPSRSRQDWWGGEVSWVSLTEIRAMDGCWIKETQIRTNKAGIANSSARILPRATVCFSRTASVGFVVIMDKPMATSQDFANWICGEELDPEFLMHALIRSRSELRSIATGATHKTIYMPALKSFHICMPERIEQERIIKRLKQQLADIEKLRGGARERINEIELLPARLLAAAFNETEYA